MGAAPLAHTPTSELREGQLREDSGPAPAPPSFRPASPALLPQLAAEDGRVSVAATRSGPARHTLRRHATSTQAQHKGVRGAQRDHSQEVNTNTRNYPWKV